MAELLTPPEVAAELRLSVYTVNEWCRTGKLPAVRVGRRWRVRRSDLDGYLASPPPPAAPRPRPVTGRFTRQVRGLPQASARSA